MPLLVKEPGEGMGVRICLFQRRAVPAHVTIRSHTGVSQLAHGGVYCLVPSERSLPGRGPSRRRKLQFAKAGEAAEKPPLSLSGSWFERIKIEASSTKVDVSTPLWLIKSHVKVKVASSPEAACGQQWRGSHAWRRVGRWPLSLPGKRWIDGK